MIRQLWNSHRIVLLAFVIALAALGYFGVKTISATIYWMDPAHQNQPLAGWMTPRYVAQSYGLPRATIEDVFQLERGIDPPRLRLDRLAMEKGLSLEEFQARVTAAAAAQDAARSAESLLEAADE